MFKDYYQVRGWLESFIPETYTRKELGLKRVRYLLKLLDNPQDKFKSVHIAGTSGKGSTAFYLARLLAQAKKSEIRNPKSETNSNFRNSNVQKVSKFENLDFDIVSSFDIRASNFLKIGLHLSPHLVDIRERMQVFRIPDTRYRIPDTALIPMRRFISLMNEIKPVVESMRGFEVGLPSYFEILVAVSFLYFAQEKVDIAVVEVGLGGRLDATNVLQPQVSIITNVGLDHTDILGKTIEEIADEKAGIIKSEVTKISKVSKGNKIGVPVITGAMGKALEVIKKVAKEKNAQLITKSTPNQVFSDDVDLNKLRKFYKNLVSSSFSFVTEETFLLSCATVASLGISLNQAKISEAFKFSFPGRFEEIEKNVILDGAHNLDKIKVLIHWIQKKTTDYRLQTTDKSGLTAAVDSSQWTVVLVVAFKKGKDWKNMVNYLLDNLNINKCIVTKFYSVTDMGFYASVEPEEIKSYIESKSQRVKVTVSENSHEAVFEAINRVRELESKRVRDLVLVTGSLYLVGEARTMWELPEF